MKAFGLALAMVAACTVVSAQTAPGDLVEHGLMLVAPPAEVVLGLWRTDALVRSDRIKKVVFLVDGTVQVTRTKPPYTAELRLAHFPTEQTVRAEGYDEKGVLVAQDEVVVNQPRGALGIWIVDPPKGRRINSGKVTARAEIMIPDGRRVDGVEFKINDTPVTKLVRPPWQTEVEVPPADLAYITAIVTLDDGSHAEAVRFLKSPQYLEEIDVDLVELFVAVTDKSNQPVLGLEQGDFEVYEAGKKQEIAKFEQVQNLPLTVGVLLDTSGSMESTIGTAARTAGDFLQHVLKPKDKAFAVSFAGRPRLDMPPTDDIEEVARSISGLRAEGETALHDALIDSLYYFRGLTGQRALVLLSDGDDNASYFNYKDVIEYARRSGVSIYTIGFKLPLVGGVRSKLTELSTTTGGRLFTTDKAQELPGIYAQIEKELRSRYLVTYNAVQKSATSAAGAYREVEVKVKKSGLQARTVRGTYQ